MTDSHEDLEMRLAAALFRPETIGALSLSAKTPAWDSGGLAGAMVGGLRAAIDAAVEALDEHIAALEDATRYPRPAPVLVLSPKVADAYADAYAAAVEREARRVWQGPYAKDPHPTKGHPWVRVGMGPAVSSPMGGSVADAVADAFGDRRDVTREEYAEAFRAERREWSSW